MKYKHSRNYIAKLIDERMTGFCGMKTVDERCKRVLNAVYGDLIPLLYATKPTKVKKIQGVDFAKWQDSGDMDIEIMIEKLNQLTDAVNSLQTK